MTFKRYRKNEDMDGAKLKNDGSCSPKSGDEDVHGGNIVANPIVRKKPPLPPRTKCVDNDCRNPVSAVVSDDEGSMGAKYQDHLYPQMRWKCEHV